MTAPMRLDQLFAKLLAAPLRVRTRNPADAADYGAAGATDRRAPVVAVRAGSHIPRGSCPMTLRMAEPVGELHRGRSCLKGTYGVAALARTCLDTVTKTENSI